MVNHLTINVSDFAASRTFYERALAPLGYVVVAPGDGYCGFGDDGHPTFWISQQDSEHPRTTYVHVAFHARDRDAVIAFYDHAIAADGKDNGRPGPRPEYGETYFAAFVRDPDGNNIEAVHT